MRKRHLPPLNALRIFETAARASSFSAAAAELGITHGAVSRQIALLEEWLGQPLFTRVGQRSVATEHARAFAAEVSTAFDRLGDAAVRFGRTPSTRVIKVNAQTTVATRWLIPKLPAFHAHHPDIEISLATFSSAEPRAPIGFDVLIQRGPVEWPEWRNFEKLPLFEERLSVVASPALLARHPLRDIKDLAGQVFVSSQTRVMEWERWLDAAGASQTRPRRFLRFDHYHVALQAVIDGLGLGIGGFPTLSHEIEMGRLVAPFAIRVPGSSYAAWLPPDVDKSRPLRSFVAWLEQQGAPSEVAT